MASLTRNDFIQIVELTKKRLREHGLSSLADDSNYLKETEDNRLVLPDPQMHALLLLQAFKRHVAANSHETVIRALAKIRKFSEGTFPEIIRIERISRIDSDGVSALDSERFVGLNSAPRRSELIASVERLIAELREAQD